MSTDILNQNELRKEIEKIKKSLINRAKKKGLWENFGQREARVLMDKFFQGNFEDIKMIIEFQEWCSNFDLQDLKRI
jgi:hypothetical protein